MGSPRTVIRNAMRQVLLISDLTVGSSLDRSGKLGVDLWRHHFAKVVDRAHVLATT